jgi:general secretion pathway protein G
VTAGRWLAIVIAFVVLLAAGYETWRLSKDRKAHFAREAALQHDLFVMRKAIDTFYGRNGRYPHSLSELVPRDLRGIPVDPVTHEADWRVVNEVDVKPNTDFTTATTASETFIMDVHSNAGPPYSEW